MSTKRWMIDPLRSNTGVSVRHLMLGTVNLRFTRWAGWVSFDDDLQNVQLQVEIDGSSVRTQNSRRDAVLRSALFLETSRHPTISLVTSECTMAGMGWRLAGELTMHGLTRVLGVDLRYRGRLRAAEQEERAAFVAHGTLDRRDWGLTWNQILDAGGLALSNRVEYQFDIEVYRGPSLPARDRGSARS
jgi:polyisoprenoid-binding protein YceI